MTIIINTKFDGGSIVPLDISNPQALNFKIRNDTNSHFAGWFYFQLNNVLGIKLNIKISELDKTAYPDCWRNYNILHSYDNRTWSRLATVYSEDTLAFSITPIANSLYFAYFEPYSYLKHMQLIAYANCSPLVRHEILGQSHEGRNIDLLVVGNSKNTHKIWLIARQHSGETMAEWFMEGLIHRLLDAQDATSRILLQDCVFYLVPNMNPDGAYHGNLRVNSVGTNLNREWQSPSLEKSPEVYYVQQKMLATGVNMFFDVHGDETLPYVFTAGYEELPNYPQKQINLDNVFKKYLLLVNPDYQTEFGYQMGHFSNEYTTMATCWVGSNFACLAQTIEMPFKDNNNLPDNLHGWNGKRSSLFGQNLLTVINLVLNYCAI